MGGEWRTPPWLARCTACQIGLLGLLGRTSPPSSSSGELRARATGVRESLSNAFFGSDIAHCLFMLACACVSCVFSHLDAPLTHILIVWVYAETIKTANSH